jgi:hypothetical protein
VILILQTVTKVTPLRIALSNQLQFLISPPAFNLLFSRDRTKNITERLNINQHVDLIAIGKAFDQSIPMLLNSSADIAGESDI